MAEKSMQPKGHAALADILFRIRVRERPGMTSKTALIDEAMLAGLLATDLTDLEDILVAYLQAEMGGLAEKINGAIAKTGGAQVGPLVADILRRVIVRVLIDPEYLPTRNASPPK